MEIDDYKDIRENIGPPPESKNWEIFFFIGTKRKIKWLDLIKMEGIMEIPIYSKKIQKLFKEKEDYLDKKNKIKMLILNLLLPNFII